MAPSAGLQLFPTLPKDPSRNPSRPHDAIQAQLPPNAALNRRSPEAEPSNYVLDSHSPSQVTNAQIASEIPRSQTSFSDAPTLIRNNSNVSHSSIQKPPRSKTFASVRGEPVSRSIFPRYDHNKPLDQQAYYPQQTTPTHVPQTAIDRRTTYDLTYDTTNMPGEAPTISPINGRSRVGRPSQAAQKMMPFPEPSSTEELKHLWKVTNGWRVQSSEGRSFNLKMTSDAEEPVHTLSSATHPFYNLRIEPTSTSAHLSLHRQDPSKAKSLSKSSNPSPGLEVLTTTLEETARRLPPNDGLVALLYPRAASSMVIELATRPRQDEEAVRIAAERECARLVWDEDSQHYYLVHPCISAPFIVQISSSPAWSRVEYTLEHPELPINLTKLVRDGHGGGVLEINTGVAARIDSFYITDVAICAMMIVAITEEKTRHVEHFEAPPSILGGLEGKPRKSKSVKSPKIEEMELDIESQTSVGKSDLPKATSWSLKLLYMGFKFVIWLLTVLVNALASIIIGISKCLTPKRLS